MRFVRILLALIAPAIAGCSMAAGPMHAPLPSDATSRGRHSQPSASGSRAEKIYFTYFTGGKNEIRTYDATADGNVDPTIRIAGPKTLLSQPYSVFAAPQGALWVCNLKGGELLRFAGNALGNVSPTGQIAGRNVPLHVCDAVAVDGAGRVAAVGLPHRDTLFVWNRGSLGDVKPARTIAGPATKLNRPYALSFASAGNLFVTNSEGNSVTVFSGSANGNVAPLRIITGNNTELTDPAGIAVVPSLGKIYVTSGMREPKRAAILIFPIGANGNVKPMARIEGPKTGLDTVLGVAVDAAGFIYASNVAGGGFITVYKPGSSGNVAPIQTIEGSNVRVATLIAVR
jgi:hypothetical protein